MKRLPIGPLLTSTVLALVLGGYLFRYRDRPGEGTRREHGPFENPIRVVSWNLGSIDAAEPLAEALAGELKRINPEVVAFQDAPGEEFLSALGQRVQKNGIVVSIPCGGRPGRVLALWLHPRIAIIERRLVPTGLDHEALSVTIVGPRDGLMHLMAVDAPNSPDADTARYLESVLQVAGRYSGGITLLIGTLGRRSAWRPAIRSVIEKNFMEAATAAASDQPISRSTVWVTRDRASAELRPDGTGGIAGVKEPPVTVDVSVHKGFVP